MSEPLKLQVKDKGTSSCLSPWASTRMHHGIISAMEWGAFTAILEHKLHSKFNNTHTKVDKNVLKYCKTDLPPFQFKVQNEWILTGLLKPLHQFVEKVRYVFWTHYTKLYFFSQDDNICPNETGTLATQKIKRWLKHGGIVTPATTEETNGPL